jgi:hypothetical protein
MEQKNGNLLIQMIKIFTRKSLMNLSLSLTHFLHSGIGILPPRMRKPKVIIYTVICRRKQITTTTESIQFNPIHRAQPITRKPHKPINRKKRNNKEKTIRTQKSCPHFLQFILPKPCGHLCPANPANLGDICRADVPKVGAHILLSSQFLLRFLSRVLWVPASASCPQKSSSNNSRHLAWPRLGQQPLVHFLIHK